MSNSTVPVMIIGSMKCGTSTLYSHLIKHPEICGGTIKEPEYFSKATGGAEYKKGEYSDLFAVNEKVHRFTLDASTGYTKYPMEKGVAGRIKEYGLNPFFIYVVRNPVDRITSHYNFMQRNIKWEHEMDDPHLVNTSKYFMQLQEFDKVFSRKDILVVDFDYLKSNPIDLCNDIFKFIGAKAVAIEVDERAVSNKTVVVNRKQVFIKSKLSGINNLIPRSIKNRLQGVLDVFLPRNKKLLTNDQKVRIKALLNDDMKDLQKEYGINVGKWGF